jgi:superfamily II DNA/RNA helicase
MTFKDINVSEKLIVGLKKQKITEPTPIQVQAYKHIMNKRDLIACSSTGSGKTLAYLLPIISQLNPESKYIQALVLVPTQELAIQVSEQFDLLCSNSDINYKSLFLIGDGNINRQIDALKSKPAVVIGTPARVYQLIKMKKLRVHDVKHLVIDEADRLIDKTYYENVLSIRKSLMKYTQVLMFSASIDKKTRKAANEISYNPVSLDISKDTNNKDIIPKTIKHYYIIADRRERIETLRKIAKAVKSKKAMIFINTKYDLEESLQKLQYHKYSVSALSGNLDKFAKRKAIDDFKSGKINYLLTTDIGARGLQIDDVDTIINVNLPEDSKDYLHRAGRCGRNGNSGVCISIITENELNKIKQYQKQFNINIVARKLYNGKLVAK